MKYKEKPRWIKKKKKNYSPLSHVTIKMTSEYWEKSLYVANHLFVIQMNMDVEHLLFSSPLYVLLDTHGNHVFMTSRIYDVTCWWRQSRWWSFCWWGWTACRRCRPCPTTSCWPSSPACLRACQRSRPPATTQQLKLYTAYIDRVPYFN